MPTTITRAAIDDTPTTLQNAATAAATGTELDVKGWANVEVQITGTYTTQSTTFQITLDGSNWVSTEGVNTANGNSATTATANGIYLVNCAGAERFRANLTTIVGTSATIVARATPYDGAVAGVGAAGSTVTANQGTANATPWPVTTSPTASSTGSSTSVAASATAVTLLAANSARRGGSVAVDSIGSDTLYVGCSATTVTATVYTIALTATLPYFEVPAGYSGKIWGIWATGTGSAKVTEYTA